MSGAAGAPPAFVLRTDRAVLPDGVRSAAVLVRAGRIEAVGARDLPAAGLPGFDLGNLMLLPGLVDAHVHVNEPGRTAWEGFASATAAAAAGGITTIADMPLNAIPVTTSAEAFDRKREAMEGKLRVDCVLHGGVVPGNAGDLLPLARRGVVACKAFLAPSGIDEFPPADTTTLRAAMEVLATLGLPLLAHAERPDDTSPPRAADPRRYRSWLASRPPSWEVRAIDELAQLSLETGCGVHIVHVSSADAVAAIERGRERGALLTAETCPHYLYFAAEEIPDAAPLFKCAPPIREARHRDALWEALERGVLDLVASDHSPAPPACKHLDDGDLLRAWGGIASLQLGPRVVWTGLRERGLGPERLAHWYAERPARLLGLGDRKGRIAPGFDADLTAWDPDAIEPVDPHRLRYRHPITPYAGRRLAGRVVRTWVRGRCVYDRDTLPEPPSGALLFGPHAAPTGDRRP
ncbi:MAG: allantoinase AllB [Planctomycetota bacterium]|nr:MAG: allantoinase AllB [Planctomycetota bacterium]